MQTISRMRAYPPILGAAAGFVACTAIYLVLTVWGIVAGTELPGGWRDHVIATVIQLIGWSLSGWFVGLVVMWLMQVRRRKSGQLPPDR